uniref:Uncharacterized protein n=1 Tax=Globisporangium ultimum (strain ATCC 200006 / CBS 805.95 / DAOM BR144) TaxID=431595 RepID=K3X0E2_GLOUD
MPPLPPPHVELRLLRAAREQQPEPQPERRHVVRASLPRLPTQAQNSKRHLFGFLKERHPVRINPLVPPH